MFKRVLIRLRERIRNRQYVMTQHARKEMNDDGLTILDVEHAILTGEILERQRDRQTNEPKYRLEGESLEDALIETALKISPTGKVVIMTVYRA